MVEYRLGEFMLTTDIRRMDAKAIHQYLSEESYWAKNIPLAVVKRSMQNSLCFGLLRDAEQIGFARVITDKATFAYLADVYVLEPYRGKGFSKWMMRIITEHPDVQGLRRWVLGTRDAHTLYAQFGFKPLAAPDRFMELHNPGVYEQNDL